MSFYRMRGLYFRGKIIGSKEVEEATDCLGECFHIVNCTSFNAFTIKDGNACICEFLANNPCGFVENNSNSSIFFQHKMCKIQTKDGTKCVMKGSDNFLYVDEKGIGGYHGDTCMEITLDIADTCLKRNNQLVLTELYENGDTPWLKLTEAADAENNCLQVQLIGNATQFQIKTNDMCVVIKQYEEGDYNWLALGPCDAYMPIYFTIIP